jgi:flavoprotein
MCADACLDERDVPMMVTGIRSRGGALAAERCKVCASACDACAEECERHLSHAEHCRICAEACPRCAEARRQMAA